MSLILSVCGSDWHTVDLADAEDAKMQLAILEMWIDKVATAIEHVTAASQ